VLYYKTTATDEFQEHGQRKHITFLVLREQLTDHQNSEITLTFFKLEQPPGSCTHTI